MIKIKNLTVNVYVNNDDVADDDVYSSIPDFASVADFTAFLDSLTRTTDNADETMVATTPAKRVFITRDDDAPADWKYIVRIGVNKDNSIAAFRTDDIAYAVSLAKQLRCFGNLDGFRDILHAKPSSEVPATAPTRVFVTHDDGLYRVRKGSSIADSVVIGTSKVKSRAIAVKRVLNSGDSQPEVFVVKGGSGKRYVRYGNADAYITVGVFQNSHDAHAAKADFIAQAETLGIPASAS